MARILFIGGTRFIGRATARFAAEAGHDVAYFHRGPTGHDLPGEHFIGELAALGEHADALRGWRPDVVVHCIALSDEHSRQLVRVFEDLDQRMVVLSSIDSYEVFRQTVAGREFGDFPVDEDDPLSAERYYLKATGLPIADTYDKNLMTDVLLQAWAMGRCRPTVLRLPMVFGPRDGQFPGRHGEAIHHVLDRRRRYVIGAIDQAHLWTFGYVDNVAAAILHAAEQDVTVGRVYNLGEERVRSKRRWAELYAEAAGHTLEVCPVPDRMLDPEHDDHAPAQHLISSGRRFRDDTGFSDPVAVDAQVERTLSWARDHRDRIGDPPDYEAREGAWATWTKTTR